ncbi:MAG: HAMP domain-containing protein [Chlorobiaceae bacterium]|nr:HAMP domain-containing protein [Chlorobiaceae bacterium]
MMIGIRQKLILGFSGLLVLVLVMGVLTIRQIDSLGGAIDIILRQNYRSVIACQKMKESLEQIDRGVLLTFTGHYDEGLSSIRLHENNFRNALQIELGNITLPGEHQKAMRIRALFIEYSRIIDLVTDQSQDFSLRQKRYFQTLLPLFQEIKQFSGEVLEMNQANMNRANDSARRMAASAHNTMLAVILACAVIALLFSFQAHRWILMPIKKLIASAEEISRGNLDLVLDTTSNDEIGQLSRSFNDMAATLRKMRKTDMDTLLRTRSATQEVFKALPVPIAVLDQNGEIEVSTETAENYFGLKPGVNVHDLGHEWMTELLQNKEKQEYGGDTLENKRYIQHFAGNRESFFLPQAVPVPAGTALILRDVTQIIEQLELKRSVIATVSHQLRTPLTSLRMSIYLLLEERIGTLNSKQAELLYAAREESERLSHILDDLLDLNRIESGKANLNIQLCSPFRLATEGVDPFTAEARDRRVNLVNTVPEGVPEVMADPERIRHVFANLLSNALRFTPPEGSITISACEDEDNVRFSVANSGEGIASEHLEHLFEQFYRVPGQQEESGIGLGLSIVKEIIEAHGGTVGAESNPESGSIFHFTLPVFSPSRA